MKKLMFAVLITIIGLFTYACQEGDINNNSVYVDDCHCDGSTVAETGANFIANATDSYGKQALLSVWQIDVNGNREAVIIETITVTEEDFFKSLPEGEYWVEISSLNNDFYGDTHFIVNGVISDVFIYLDEYQLVKVVFTRLDDSPVSAIVGKDIPVFDFSSWISSYDPISLSYQTFQIYCPPSVIIEKAHLQWYTLAGWKEVAIPNENWMGSNNFSLTLDPYLLIHHTGINNFRLTLDILGANPGDTLQAEMVDVGDSPLFFPNVKIVTDTLPIGNKITF